MENSENVPDWLNNAFLQNALSSYKNDDSVKVSDFKVNKNFSQHYASSMLQCQINFATKTSASETIHVVIKAEPLDDEMKMKLVSESLPSLFSNEITMYRETIPAIRKLFAKHGYNVDFAPE